MALTFERIDPVPVWDDARLMALATDREKRLIEGLRDYGSYRLAAEALGCCKSNIGDAIKKLQARAAREGYAPGHWEDGTPPGYQMKNVTMQRQNPDGTYRWERLHPVKESLEGLIARCEERLADFPAFTPRPAPVAAESEAAKLTNFLGLFDLHIGESISSDDPAGRWNLAIARRTIIASVDHAIAKAPKAKRMVLCFGGDVAHYDSLKPVTPKSRHVLNADGDASDMADAVIDVAYHAIDAALASHDEVHLIWAAGNHDEYTAVWMPRMIARTYRDEPRLKVIYSRVPYYALLFGKVMICVHHGHGAKLTELAGKFAAMFRPLWGQAEYAYAHAGHQHHIHAKEKDGMLATQHPSLAPSDDYALSKGLVSRRGCKMITYHDDFGEASDTTTRPEMLGVFDAD